MRAITNLGNNGVASSSNDTPTGSEHRFAGLASDQPMDCFGDLQCQIGWDCVSHLDILLRPIAPEEVVVLERLQAGQVVIEDWRRHYNTIRPHSALGWKPPAPETIVPMDQRPIMHQLSNWTTRWGPTKSRQDLTARTY